MDQSTPPKSDTLSSQVLEYFRKHSGNQNLSSYLRGIIPQQESKVKCEIDVNTLAGISDSEGKEKPERDVNVSPTSSLTSNRKLEWDNGADIGYENSNKVNLHKSFSLPTLTAPLNSNETNQQACLTSTTSSCTPEEQKLDTTTSSSFAFKPLSSETPSEVENGKESIIKLVHRKVGSPVAQSTPNAERPMYHRETFPKVSTIATDTPENNIMRITELKCVAKFTKSKIVRLAATKPILIDCVNYKKYDDKDIQTVKCVEFVSVAVQTEVDTMERSENIPYDKEKQLIEYIKYSDSGERSGSRSIGTNTVSDLVSNCDSFEYLCPTDAGNKASSERGEEASRKSSLNSETSSEKTLSSNVTEASTKSTPLGEMISCNLSKHLKVDIDKSILLLQRLLKSKRYDKVTKDYFVKKIVEKILNSSYSGDSKDEGSSTSSKVSEKLLEPSLKKRLQENVPWIPATFNDKPKKLGVKTFSNDIFPEDKEKRKLKDSRFTITSSLLDHRHPKETNVSIIQSSQDEGKKPTVKNWKDDITRSERLFEAGSLKFDGDKTDSLIRFAKKERNNQINWINDEISHLNKLRNLLQENECGEAAEKPNIEIKVLTKPHVEDMKKMKKSASVYVITTDRTTSDDNDGRNATGSLGPCPTTKDLSCKGKVFNITSELREAKLVSSELYQSNKPYTCVRRYVFEIPVQCSCDTLPCAHEHNDKKPPALRLSDQDYGTSSVAFEDADDVSVGKETGADPDDVTNKGSAVELPHTDSNRREPDRYSRGSQASGTEFEEKKRRVHSVTAVPYLPFAPLKHPSFNAGNQDNQDKFSRGTQSSYTEFLDDKRKVQSLDEVNHLASITKNVIASQSDPVSSRRKSHELANVVLNEVKADNEISIGTNTEERYRRPSVEFRGMKDLSDSVDRSSTGSQQPEPQGPTNARELYRSSNDRQRPSIDSQKSSSSYRVPTADYEQSAPGYQRTAFQSKKPTSNSRQSSIDCQTNDPNYQRVGSNYQTTDPDYQRVNPVYQRPAPDFQEVADFQTTDRNDQKPGPNYQRSGADYRRTGADYRRTGGDYQRPGSDDQTSNSDYQRLTPVYQRPLSEYRQESVSDHQRSERYAPDFLPTAAPEYQKQAAEVQTLNPNYQRPPDFHKSISDYQKPNYQRPPEDYQKPGTDFETSDSNYQRPLVSRQGPTPDYPKPAYDYQKPAADYQRSGVDRQPPNIQYQQPNSAYEKPTQSYRKPSSDSQRQAADYQTSDYRATDHQRSNGAPNYQKTTGDYQVPDSNYQNYTRGYQRRVSDHQKPLADYQKPASNYYRPDTDYQAPDPGYERPTSPNQRPAPDYQKPSGDYQSSSSNNQALDPRYQRVHSTNPRTAQDYQKSPDYEKSEGDYQTADPNYQKVTPPYQRPPPDYEIPAPDYQNPSPDYQRPAAEYETAESQGPATERPASAYQKPGPSAQSEHKKNITPTSSASSVSTSSSSQTILIRICPCCKRNNSKYKSVLQGLPNEIENSLCRPCHRNTTMAVDPTTGQYKTYPEHVCNCYTLMKTETVNKIKQTVKQLEELENEEQCCDCSRKRCKCPGFGRSKKGIAYTLTLEDNDDDASESSEQDVNRKRSLDEIKLKIPDKKKHKHKGHHRKHHRKHKRDQSASKMTLQEYLCANRPNFVQNAEERRKTLVELAYMRERRCQKYKQLLAMTNGTLPTKDGDQTAKKGLYTTKEMRKITAKNYKKLPEVQKKLEQRRKNDNKKANKLLADIFNKKLQQNTLKGKVDMSTTTSVIKFI